MNDTLDEKNKDLLRILQKEFPISERPYLEIAKKLNITEDEVISRIESLIDSSILRKFGAIINVKKIGYVSILGAIDVIEENIEETAKIINKYPGVTHNYLREGHPNIWFTLIEPNKEILEKNLAKIEEKVGTKIIKMPVKQMFKIGVKLVI